MAKKPIADWIITLVKILLMFVISLEVISIVIVWFNSADKNPACQAELENLKSPDNLVAYTLTNTMLSPAPLYHGPQGDRVDGWDISDFGAAVAMHGGKVLVGAPWQDTKVEMRGAAHLFDANSGHLLHSLFSPKPEIGEKFGFSVAIYNDKVVIGAIAGDSRSEDKHGGSAYVFDAANGKLLHTLTNPTPNALDEYGSDLFGGSVATFGNKILVGASLDSAELEHSGAAYLFDAKTGKLLNTLLNPTPALHDHFGSSVAIFGDRAVIGAGYNSGAVYLFDATTAKLLHIFLNPTPARNDSFGGSVAIFGNTVLIAAINDFTCGKESGAVYVFDAISGELLRTLYNPLPKMSRAFGESVAMYRSTALIGADSRSGGRGAAYLFDVNSGVLLHTFVNPTPDDVGSFGPIALHEGKVVVGARGCCSVEQHPRAYLFTLSAASTD